ncbi:hypothetical protein RhiirA4_272180 [Rhizophagus irregularis]|uniref:Uncharacterized protein n=1 Tax=Rhizophagus irregularis TaxID=588596 RepID=A0A2I1GW24_9GLOM|nr:hypothetical protein RhiirA4_272180 [Rhizophagus irregularis]
MDFIVIITSLFPFSFIPRPFVLSLPLPSLTFSSNIAYYFLPVLFTAPSPFPFASTLVI